LLTKHSADAHDNGAFYLRLETRGIEDSPTLEGLTNFEESMLSCGRVDFDLGASRDDGILFRAACQSDAAARFTFLHPFLPAEFSGCRFQYGNNAVVLQIGEAEFEGIETSAGSELIHETFAREVVGGGRKRTVGALPQRRIARHKANAGSGGAVGRINPRTA
jgi:hypothetical protein